MRTLSDTIITIALCYAAVGLFVWIAGVFADEAQYHGPGWMLASLLVSLLVVVLCWPVVVWRAVGRFLGRG